MKTILLAFGITIIFQACAIMNRSQVCDEKCQDQVQNKEGTKMKKKPMACKLTTPELRERKATVLADLKKAMLEKKELQNGYAYKFEGSDEMVDKLAEFVKTERLCCDFFDFRIDLKADNTLWLEISGEDGVKEFIDKELEL